MEMGLPQVNERRFDSRKKLTGLLPGRLVKSETMKDVRCRPVDVSTNGIGILSEVLLNPGELLMMRLKDSEIEFKVAWGRPDFGKQDSFRYGLAATDKTIDIEAIFLKAGCLK